MQLSIEKGKRILISLTTLVALSACGSESSSSGTDTVESSDESVEAGVSALSGAANSGNDEATSFAFVKRSLAEKILLGFSVEAAITACGIPARQDTCASGMKEATYTACSTKGKQTYSGTVNLDFSDAACGMDSNNDSVTRTVNITRSGFFKSEVVTSSDDHEDYRGNTFGGGSKLTRIGIASMELEVLGVRKLRTKSNGKVKYDVQTRTTSPLILAGTWNGDRTIKSGTLEVVHNNAEYVATFAFEDVKYNKAECCYPISGKATVTYTGSIEGSAGVEFGSCGSVKIGRSGKTRDIALAGCE